MEPNSPRPRVSVVMGVYNGAAYLPDALNSLAAQTFDDFEVIIVDDASIDSTPEVLHAWPDARFRWVRNPVNGGLTASLNRALSLARGELIARLDADDLAMPTRLQRQVDYFDAHPETGLIGTARMLRRDGLDIEESLDFAHETELRFWMLFNNAFCHSSVMFRRSALAKAGVSGYDEGFRVAQDYALWSTVMHTTHLARLSEPLVISRVHPGQISEVKAEAQRDAAVRVSLDNLGRVLAPMQPTAGVREKMMSVYPSCPLPATPDSLQGGALVLAAFDGFFKQPMVDRSDARRIRRIWLLRFLNSWTLRDWRANVRSGLLIRAFRAGPFTVCWYLSLRVVWAVLTRLGVRYKIPGVQPEVRT